MQLQQMYTQTHAHTHTHTHVPTHTLHTHTYACTHTHVRMHAHTRTHARTHTYACTHTHVRMHAHTHTTQHTHTHTLHNTHTRTHYTQYIHTVHKMPTATMLVMLIQWTSTGTPLRLHEPVQTNPPGAGLVTHRRLYHVSWWRCGHPKSHLDLHPLRETWTVTHNILTQLSSGTHW